MRRIRTTIQALIGATVIAGGMAALTPAAWADTIPVACSETALVAAINLANTTSASDTLVLAGGCTYTLTSSHGSLLDGPDGLPPITTPIAMIGPATITRSSSAPSFRIAEVSTPPGSTIPASLTLTTSVALTNGRADGDRDGGGILNHSAVTLTNSSLSNNTATRNGGGLANADTPSGTAPAATFTDSPVSNNTAGLRGGGIYNGTRGTLTTTGTSGSPLIITGNTVTGSTLLGLLGSGGRGGGIAAVGSTATTLTQTAVTVNHAAGALLLGPGTAGGVYREGGTMTTTSSPITANTPNNCVGSVPAVPNCTG
jgi:hypothetical protein